jgi:hypothetical protein
MLQLLVGGIVCLCTIAIHALVMTAVIRVAHIMSTKHTSRPLLHVTGVMIGTVSVLMAAHVLEVIVWALAYWMTDMVPGDSGFVYFAFVNYTTLGYGDVIPVREWQLLGPITAMNGVLLFGWSTAVMFEVLRKTMLRPR